MDHQQSSRKQPANSPEVAMANEVFDQFCGATTLKSILGYYRQLCELLKIRPNTINHFYPKLKLKLRSWKAQALWKKFDQRANHKCYNRGKACPNTRVLIIGGGPCGLRSAIEAQLLGAKVVVVEKRDRMSRNNVLHLWPFVIQDLRGLGAKKFFGKFCAGSIDHISIRQLQCILLKVALILGVEFHENVSFDSLIPPPENQEDGKIGWRAKTTPADHPVSQYEFDVLIGADGKRNTLEGFKRKEFRGKLAIAITANFINKRTEAEARVEEISGVAFIFNQKFFKELYQETGIDLENIVYYKDDTHYFVMTAKKHSLIDKGVILQDHADTAKLLAKENVDREALMLYAREAAEFSTEYQMMDMEFAVNHYGQPDVAMFDFTSMYAAENASRVLERHGHRLMMILVGDSLLEPFWPTGSGCARGFLSSLDACWAIKGWGASISPLEVLAERESIYRLLGQTTPENLNRDYAAYTLDPHTRYPNLNASSVTPIQVRSLLDTDDPDSIKQPLVPSEVDIPKKRRRRDLRGESQVHPDTLLRWLQKQVALYDSVRIEDMGASFKDGLAICAIIHRYRPDLIDFHSLTPDDIVKNNQLAFDILEKELGISPVMTSEEMEQCDVPDKLAMFSYLTQIYEVFRGEIPHIRHPKLEPENEERPAHSKQLSQLTPDQKAQLLGRIVSRESTARTRQSRSRHNENVHPMDKKGDTMSRRSRKRRSTEKMGATVDREPKIHAGHRRNSIDEEFSGRIKNIEDKLKGSAPSDKKPRDLLRAIGKIEKTDWNVKEIEKKIEENKMGRGVRHEKVERVPKWSREQFLARQIKMEKKGRDQKESDSKYADIDNTLKSIDRKIKEGNVLGYNKVSAMAEQFSNKNQDAEPKVQKSSTKTAIALPAQGGSEICHFCNKRVYLMERLSAEGKFFHRGCFRCEYCSTSLRIGNHTFDREKNGGRFYCTQHFGFSGTMKARAEKKRITALNKENIPNAPINVKTPEKGKIPLEGVVGLDLLDRGQTPERIEFENLAGLSDAEEAQSQMDEDEWTDRNFGASTAEMGSSDDISDMSDSDEENEVFEEAIDQPLTTEGTLELAKNWTLRYSHPHTAAGQSDTGSNEYEDSSDEYTSEEDESGTATEDEDEIRARELRKQEVWLKHPARNSDTDTGSETEVNISQDSLDNISEESRTTSEPHSEQIPNLISSAVSNVDNNESLVVKDVNDTKDVRNPEILHSDLLVLNSDVDTSSKNEVNLELEQETVPNEINGSIIPVTSVDCDLISVDVKKDNNLDTSETSPKFSIAEDNLDTVSNKDDYNSEYESFVEDNTAEYLEPNSGKLHDFIPHSSGTNFDTNNDESLDRIKSENSCLDAELQTDVVGVMLPDAIPCKESKYVNATVNDNEDATHADKKLPDLIASSPKRSRPPSRSSSSDIYDSIETLYTLNHELSDKIETENQQLSNTINEVRTDSEEQCEEPMGKNPRDEFSLHKKANHLKLSIKSAQDVTCPIVTITSPSPTNEEQREEPPLEITMLTLPKEVNQIIQPDLDDSFGKLKQDLRQRKAKNKTIAGELKPLSTETAQRKISKYFVEKKEPSVKCNQTSSKKSEGEGNSADIQIVELEIKPKLSTKVDAKDIMKYFDERRSSHSSDQLKIDTGQMHSLSDTANLNENFDELNLIDDDVFEIINAEFQEIEQQNKNIALTNGTNIESQFNSDPVVIQDSHKKSALNEVIESEKQEQSRNVSNSEVIENLGHSLHTENGINKERTVSDILCFGTESKLKILATTPQSDQVKTNIHASDSSLHIKKDIDKESDGIRKASKSSFELNKTSSDNLPVTKVKVTKQDIGLPAQVDKVNINNKVISPTANEPPRRPERKHEINSSPKYIPSNSQFTPEVPSRKKTGKRKSNITSSQEEVGQSNSSSMENLSLSKTSHEKPKDDHGLKNATEGAIAKVVENAAALTRNICGEERIPRTNNVTSNKLDLPESTKPMHSKNDRSKKDKCIVS